MQKALELAAYATTECGYTDWWWKERLGKAYYQLGMLRDAEKQLASAAKNQVHSGKAPSITSASGYVAGACCRQAKRHGSTEACREGSSCSRDVSLCLTTENCFATSSTKRQQRKAQAMNRQAMQYVLYVTVPYKFCSCRT